MDFLFGSAAADVHESSVSLDSAMDRETGSAFFLPVEVVVDERASKGETKSKIDLRPGEGGCACVCDPCGVASWLYGTAV